jgi:hypothetical protein
MAEYDSSVDYVDGLLSSPRPIEYAQKFREEFIEDPELLERALKKAYKHERCDVFEALAITMFDEVVDFVVDDYLGKPDLHYYLRVDPRRLLDSDDPGRLELACKQAKANADLQPLVVALDKLAHLLPSDRFEREFKHYAPVASQWTRNSLQELRSPVLARMIGKTTCRLPDIWVDAAFARDQEEFLSCYNAPHTTKLAEIIKRALVLGRWNFINYLYEQHKDAVRHAVLTFPKDMRDYIIEGCDVAFDGSRGRDLFFRAKHLGIPIGEDLEPDQVRELINFTYDGDCPELVRPLWLHENYNTLRTCIVDAMCYDYTKAKKLVLMVPKRYRRGFAKFLRSGTAKHDQRWAVPAAEIFEANFKT